MSESLSILEMQVAQARAKLARDLASLRSPQSYREFGAGLKSEARSIAKRVWDDVKARAATNPSASFAIGAGIAWRLFRHPPIATALIGAGIVSLWRTAPVRIDDGDYLHTAQQRLGEQVTGAVDAIGNYAGEAVVGTQETVSTYAQSAREGVERLAKSAAEEAGEGIRKMSDAASDVSDKAVGAAYRATSEFNRAVSDPDIRDQLLLGVAGLAVVAAVGLAYQGRSD